ncbi:deoxyribonuclease IV [Bacillus sp. HMF5848]|nr:deoxyribonuclease IV [Bacillus sp. HMF5848]
MHFGCHVSIKNGFLSAAQYSKQMGASCFQYFPKNPRSITIKEFNDIDAKLCAAFCLEHNILSIAHAPYPISLMPDDDKREAVKLSILNDLEIADACGSIGVVVHFGNYHGTDMIKGYQKLIHFLDETLNEWNGKALLLIENNAGKGGDMGTSIEELSKIRELSSERQKVGFCLDTCHLFASGIWSGDNWSTIEQKCVDMEFFESLFAIHLNNSHYTSGSMKDRHANIRQGKINVKNLLEIVHCPYIENNIPFILETPSHHAEELQFLKNTVM